MTGTPPARRVIRVFPDYARDWPLWENSTPSWDVGYTTDPATYGLSDQLTRNLAMWHSFWETHFDAFAGWDSDSSRTWWRDEGVRVVEELRLEVAAFADVQYEPWPLDSGTE